MAFRTLPIAFSQPRAAPRAHQSALKLARRASSSSGASPPEPPPSQPPETWAESGPAATAPTRAQALQRWGVRSLLAPSGGVGDVPWSQDERLDFSLEFSFPKGWMQRTRVRENHLNIDVIPPLPPYLQQQQQQQQQQRGPSGGNGSALSSSSSSSGGGGGSAGSAGSAAAAASVFDLSQLDMNLQPSLHGLSISSFAYHRRVENPDPALLLRNFLHRFDKSVKETVRVLSYSDDVLAVPLATSLSRREPPTTAADGADASREKGGRNGSQSGGGSTAERIASQLGGAVCEIEFRPGAPPLAQSKLTPQQLDALPRVARGLCRAFFAPSGRFHYVVLFAVPKAEYAVVEDCVVHGMLQVANVAMGTERRTPASGGGGASWARR